jgi:hypothetical protein
MNVSGNKQKVKSLFMISEKKSANNVSYAPITTQRKVLSNRLENLRVILHLQVNSNSSRATISFLQGMVRGLN